MKTEKKQQKEWEVQALVDDVKADFERRKAERKAFELQWQLNMDFANGKQNNTVSSFGTVVPAGKQFWWQQREVFNHISPMIESRLARLADAHPEICVIPADSDNRSRECADVCKKVIASTFQKVGMTELSTAAQMWSEMTGTAFYKIAWDNTGGAQIGEVNKKPIFQGDISVTVCSPFEIYPDNTTASSLNEVQSLIHAKVYKTSTVKEIWGVDVNGGDVEVFDFNNKGKTELGNAVVVIERYEKPTKEMPLGRFVSVAGDKLLYNGSLPFCNAAGGARTFPFVRQTSESVPGCFWGRSVIERAIPVQRAYNSVKNRKTEFINRLACGCISVEDGSVDLESLENEGLAPGTVLVYRQGFNAPKFFEGGSLPAELEREEERLLREFATITGGSDIARAAEVSNISGIALQILTDQDNRRMNRAVSEIMNAYATIATQILRLYRQFAVERRLEQLVKGQEFEVFTWDAGVITSDQICVERKDETARVWYGK